MLVLSLVPILASWITVTSAQQQPSTTNEPAHKVYVAIGCLEGGAESNSAFKLTGAKNVGQSPTSTPGSAAASQTDIVYELQPVSSVGEEGISRERLQSHVGKRVEVTIRPVEVAPAQPSSSTNATSGAEKPKQPVPERYNVVKISEVAASCK
jgi:hypothetical protein